MYLPNGMWFDTTIHPELPLYQVMPILRFEQFTVRSLSPAEKRDHQVSCVNAALPTGFPPLPGEVSRATLSDVNEILAGP